MRSPGLNGEGELRGQPANPVHLEKWPLKWSLYVYVYCFIVQLYVCLVPGPT